MGGGKTGKSEPLGLNLISNHSRLFLPEDIPLLNGKIWQWNQYLS